jgi:hypothetical protein
MIQAENSATAFMDIPQLDPSIMAGFSPVSYSGMAGSRIVMGDGIILGLSARTMKSAGDSRVKSGMELALMVAWPGSDAHLCFADTRVSWIQDSFFTVNLVAVPDHIRTRLKDLIEWFIE